MNYRIDQRREQVISAIRSGSLAALLLHDQLNKEMKFNRGFRFKTFMEGPIDFAPTYKYDHYSSEYDSSPKSRTPAWCDRILWRTRDVSRVRLLHYQRYEVSVSDHRPISAAFSLMVKVVNQQARGKVKAIVEAAWMKEEAHLLEAARTFILDQGIL
jgi:hypothetical protein